MSSLGLALRAASSTSRPRAVACFNLASHLSLEAPLILLAWVLLAGRELSFAASGPTLIIQLLSVWIIYLADHWLDVRRGAVSGDRHRFMQAVHHQILPLGVALIVFDLWLVVTKLSPRMLWNDLYVVAALLLYFAAVHLLPLDVRSPAKEIAVGVIFALGTIAVQVEGLPLRSIGLIASLATLVALNCLLIELRQTRRSLLTFRIALWTFAAITTALIWANHSHAEWWLCMSISTLGIAWTANVTDDPESTRLGVDAALLSPLLLYLFR